MNYFYGDLFTIIEYDFITNKYFIEIYDIDEIPRFDPFEFYPNYKINNKNIFFTLWDIYDVFFNYVPLLRHNIVLKVYNYKFNTKFEKPFIICDFNSYPYLTE